ncbi:class E sortase, partial [Actinoalloteichus caeruleus]|uniref:class E sortase n=1 Tax=Actinoalloteichus cyanogriseus TaxID=2893586 RepID=UPI0020101094
HEGPSRPERHRYREPDEGAGGRAAPRTGPLTRRPPAGQEGAPQRTRAQRRRDGDLDPPSWPGAGQNHPVENPPPGYPPPGHTGEGRRRRRAPEPPAPTAHETPPPGEGRPPRRRAAPPPPHPAGAVPGGTPRPREQDPHLASETSWPGGETPPTVRGRLPGAEPTTATPFPEGEPHPVRPQAGSLNARLDPGPHTPPPPGAPAEPGATQQLPPVGGRRRRVGPPVPPVPPSGARPAHAPAAVPPEELDQPTELIPPVPDRPGRHDTDAEQRGTTVDEHPDHDEEPDDEPNAGRAEGAADVGKPPRRREGAGRVVARSVGELMLTAGMVVLLFVVYEVFVTDWFAARNRAQAEVELQERWAAGENERGEAVSVLEGDTFAQLFIPSFGPDYHMPIVEGTSDSHLQIGVGHYVNTAMPGEVGNFSIAGHRDGWGSPFNNLDRLRSCDSLVIEDRDNWYVYRVLPMEDELADWEATRAERPECVDVPSLLQPDVEGGGIYGGVVGRHIVDPSQGEVILPVPSNREADITVPEARPLITLTTCHPRYSDRQRMIIHGLLTAQYPKEGEGAGPPPELSQS